MPNDYVLTIISNIGMISLIALSAYLLLVTGQISFGQQAFFGISAYAGAIATTLWGWPFWLALIFGSGLAGLAAGLIGLLTLRISDSTGNNVTANTKSTLVSVPNRGFFFMLI